MAKVALVVPADGVERFTDALPPDAGERVLVVGGGEERTDSVVAGHHGPDRRRRGGGNAGPRPRRCASRGLAGAHGAGRFHGPRRHGGRAGAPGRRLAEDGGCAGAR